LENLEYVTKSENTLHAIHVLGKMGHKRQPTRGEKSHFSKLADPDIIAIRQIAEQGVLKHDQIARQFNVSRSTISMILRGETWSHI
jgi:DNA invertase Pin-like site-specific DNA recombinase